MAMKRCSKCDELYSDTYQVCPFCEEEESIRRGKPIRRRAKDYRNRKGGHALGILAMIAVLILGGWGVWHFWGDNIAEDIGIRDTGDVDMDTGLEGDGIVSTPGIGDPGNVQMPEDTVTPPDGGGDTTTPPEDGTEVTPPEDVEVPTTPVSLNKTDFTLFSAGETTELTASGGSGNYTWTMDKTLVATVDSTGEKVTVKAIGGGVAKLTVTDGFTSAECTVRVRGPAASGEDTTPSGPITLNREDMTLGKGESFQLKASGTSSTVSWSIADSSVASISESGWVKGLASGTTTVTARVDGQTIKCIVRVR